MNFGKLTDITELDRIDLTLPEDHPDTIPTLQSFKQKNTAPNIFIGSARWGERVLVGKIYPPKTQSRDYLYHYSRFFTTIELNMTHYRIPTVEMVEQWREVSDPDFTFCPKLPQLISHRPDFGQSTRATDPFLEALYTFDKQLGLPFMQLPPHFSPESGKSLFSYLETWPQDMPLAIEFRHPAWFGNEKIKNRAFDLLQELGISPVITDTAGRRDVIHQRLTTASVLIRFVGNYLHPTDFSRIDAWVERLKTWIAAGLRNIYFIVHQPQEDLCVDLAQYLVKRLNEVCGTMLALDNAMSQQGVQKSLFE